MTTATERLARLGLELPAVATPLGVYVPALRHADMVYTSGQLPLVDGDLLATGLVGHRDEDVTPERANECARIAALNAIAAAADAAGGLDNIVRVIRVNGFVASAPGFTAQPAVINGASSLIGEVFGDAGRHARSAVGVASLPVGAPVEVELTVAVAS
ncbi:RidA family protein [Demequina aurantiaca]|uniref:RidA family protein n=1 Tax=Demequina aurantiaca TaxID=676200 RepID=UPI0007835E52|nr:RidA family protein [Demequina aurantiaca]